MTRYTEKPPVTFDVGIAIFTISAYNVDAIRDNRIRGDVIMYSPLYVRERASIVCRIILTDILPLFGSALK